MQISQLYMQNIEWYLADLKSKSKNTIETVEKSLTDMFIRLVRIYHCLYTGYVRLFCNIYFYSIQLNLVGFGFCEIMSM